MTISDRSPVRRTEPAAGKNWRRATFSPGSPAVNGRSAWLLRIVIAAGTMACAVGLTHVWWEVLKYTPFLLAFGAAVVTTVVGGREAGWFAAACGAPAFSCFPPAVPREGLGRLLGGFAFVSGS